jgi:hypothetical protein
MYNPTRKLLNGVFMIQAGISALLVFGFLTLPMAGYAQYDGAYLDAPYPPHAIIFDDAADDKDLNGFSDTNALITLMTPVRSQMSRGTCSIFSATAMLEGLMRIHGHGNSQVDLSEEFLQFNVNAGSTNEGSYAIKNFNAVKSYGMAREVTLPYLGDNWLTWENSTAQRRCGYLEGTKKESCLIVHHDPDNLYRSDAELLDSQKPWYDPELLAAKREGRQYQQQYLTTLSYNNLYNTAQIKSLLEQGTPVILEQTFYYGAWNHRIADELQIGRNQNHWNKGIVGYPFDGSKDRALSPTKRAGHSVLLVGYDDSVEIEFPVKMEDGTTKSFRLKGVYYFKNSWGAGSFGVETEIDGIVRPGYGVMTQKYAHDFGSFYQVSIDQ